MRTFSKNIKRVRRDTCPAMMSRGELPLCFNHSTALIYLLYVLLKSDDMCVRGRGWRVEDGGLREEVEVEVEVEVAGWEARICVEGAGMKELMAVSLHLLQTHFRFMDPKFNKMKIDRATEMEGGVVKSTRKSNAI